ncbi:DUF4294 domain-containing protein [Bacteroides sp. 214]|uniref:DUF4294 domain-containing protein n=1 Tax=Bacteroides sp. 214 TaxID=2302935 RepID=UPI0013D3DA9D|nr:DUF4294 domain-containing protein [Bacteroides sp. 214]NDW12143.1 DUF4294 domain-containing protein [Bacteroides sp. 214]
MRRWLNMLIITALLITFPAFGNAQEKEKDKEILLVPMCVYQGDTIPYINLPEVHIFKPLVFKNKKEQREYDRLVRNVKITLPYSKDIYRITLETYEYLQTLPNEKSKERHIKRVEKGIKEQYTSKMKKLSFTQGKLLIKLVDRECNQSSYQLLKAFMGPFKAGFYQAFASVFGASLKKQYDPKGEDKLIERVVILVENGQI